MHAQAQQEEGESVTGGEEVSRLRQGKIASKCRLIPGEAARSYTADPWPLFAGSTPTHSSEGEQAWYLSTSAKSCVAMDTLSDK